MVMSSRAHPEWKGIRPAPIHANLHVFGFAAESDHCRTGLQSPIPDGHVFLISAIPGRCKLELVFFCKFYQREIIGLFFHNYNLIFINLTKTIMTSNGSGSPSMSGQ